MKMLLKFLSGWIRKKDGATAIEFALLAIPYVFLTVGIIELSIAYATAALLEGATNSAARMIRTGQLQESGSADPAADFRAALCSYASVLINCEDVQIEVVRMDSYFNYHDYDVSYDDQGRMVERGFDPGGVNDKVLVRAAYQYHMMTPFIGPLLAGTDNTLQFISTIVLQAEPYEFQDDSA